MTEKVSESQIHAVYELGKQVANNELGLSAAAEILAEEYRMKQSTAVSYVNTLRCILDGREYQRTVNLAATRYFLERIRDDFGQSGLQRAVSACNQHLRYYGRKGKSELPSLRTLLDEFESPADLEGQDAQARFYKEVRHSIADDDNLRQRRLEQASPIPKTEIREVRFFLRNPDVVAAVLLRANGFCERCNREAPFVRAKDGTPYLEVHHVVQLADGGEDTVDNAIALCPNCHRELHFGVLP